MNTQTIPKCSPYVYPGVVIGEVQNNEITLESIINAICEVFNIEPYMLKIRTRERHIVVPRQMAIYIIRKKLPMHTLKFLGDLFGGYDHTTILHAANTTQDLLDTSEDYRNYLSRINMILSISKIKHLYNSLSQH